MSWREVRDIWPVCGSVVSVNSMQTSFRHMSAVLFFIFKSSEKEVAVCWQHHSGAVAVVLSKRLPCYDTLELCLSGRSGLNVIGEDGLF